ncbi:TATA box-binding protein-associated factor RNA polymerase I subunit B [Trichonephila clavipes]|uniref:TATA box-binding protein-associated factor RNA polymerase I subunit B n=1 Tax=Trichonephila clavipes TaxID=2585209 RepID=A0A8X6VLF6_TRICX|nr:TATA box-binding protein-associated factor RNA polymerase I subunit B [Trichonephila clavipes]
MNCVVCDGSTFEIVDGTYYCEECNTQIESSRQEECEQESFRKRFLVSKKKKEGKKRRAKERKFYADWITPEAYTIILRKQVSALISLGASDNLKDVVLNIWCRFLQKCKIAFRNDDMAKTSIVPCLGKYAYRRDVSVLYEDKARIKRVKKSDTNMSDVGVSIDEEVTDSTLAESDMQSNDLSSVTDNGNISKCSSKDTSILEDTPLPKKVKLSSEHDTGFAPVKAQGREKSVDEMDLPKTLCFCYLGLLYTGDLILLSDILRLVNERKIPYLDATKCIQFSLELQSHDLEIFTKDLKLNIML